MELDYRRRGIRGVHRLKTWGEESADAFKGCLQEAEYSVVLGFGLYRYTHKKKICPELVMGDRCITGHGCWCCQLGKGRV